MTGGAFRIAPFHFSFVSMSSGTVLVLQAHNQADLARRLEEGGWVVACLCAAWCDTCRSYQRSFEELAARHPDKQFVWIDIEDQADMLGDIDVENFPTLLIQRGDIVTFFGTMLPDIQLADRLIQAQVETDEADLRAQANAGTERRDWQRLCNLRTWLDAA
jgi:thiol-disulfide isomerase/thioredoxin